MFVHLHQGLMKCASGAQQKCAYSALHLQALSECSPLDFQRSSIVKRNLVNYHLIMAGPSPDTMSYFTHQYFSLQPKHLHLFFHSHFQFCQCVIDVFIFTVLLTYCLGERKKKVLNFKCYKTPLWRRLLHD